MHALSIFRTVFPNKRRNCCGLRFALSRLAAVSASNIRSASIVFSFIFSSLTSSDTLLVLTKSAKKTVPRNIMSL